MVFALALLFVVVFAFFVSPLIAVVLFLAGAIGFVLMYGMSRRSDESAAAGPESHAAARGRREARTTRIR